MRYNGNTCEDIKIAYVGGGSRGWAWGLMSDLVGAPDISGTVALYDIDRAAADANVIIGNKFNDAEGARSRWQYHATATLDEALTGADFVVISILPGTFDEMESDVHAPEAYGIYQSVGDTVGPGGLIRALRTVPMIETIARGVERCCPRAWVINYTNPMTVCVRTLYATFPAIRAFGCCHEVFGTQKFLAAMAKEMLGLEEDIPREDIRVNVVGINHFTWLTEARYRQHDLFPLYERFVRQYGDTGYTKGKDDNWMNNAFLSCDKVKMDLFRRLGVIAAAGDRHLAEFCPGTWYLKDPETVRRWGFGLTPVSYRKEKLAERLETSRKRVAGEEILTLSPTGEDGVNQIRALLGLHEMTTNVNLPNRGQIKNLPLGAVVETNAHFTGDSVIPLDAGELPMSIYALVARVVGVQEMTVKAAMARDLEAAFDAFLCDPLVTIPRDEARALFDTMIENTRAYLSEYK